MLEFAARVDWHAQEEFLKVDMPVGVQAANAQYECQYGMVERPIQKNSRGDEAKFESCTHRFVRVADAAYAVAVVNASTYGSDVSPIHAETADGHARGTMIRLSLLSAPLYPDPRTDRGTPRLRLERGRGCGYDRHACRGIASEHAGVGRGSPASTPRAGRIDRGRHRARLGQAGRRRFRRSDPAPVRGGRRSRRGRAASDRRIGSGQHRGNGRDRIRCA